jgi:LytS/YehU family sensor histidine kinase
VEIAIEDDGPGFDAAAAAPGHGLALVRDRLAMTLGSDAALLIDSRPGYSRVAIRLPRAATPEP